MKPCIINSKFCKYAICEKILHNPHVITNLFPPSIKIDTTELTDSRVWKRTSKEKINGGIYRTFAPIHAKSLELADQVTAEVVTDLTDTIIESILFEG